MFKNLDEIKCRGRRVIVRGDLNVPMQFGAVTDSTRLDRFAATVQELSDKGARVAVVSSRPPTGRSEAGIEFATNRRSFVGGLGWTGCRVC